jgi:hypothetical protein
VVCLILSVRRLLRRKAKPIGYVVQSPDQQYKTGQMGKQPIKVYP